MSDPGLKIRPATAKDAKAIIALYRHLSLDDQSPDLETARANLQSIAAIPNSQVFTGWIGNDLVTSCTLFTLPNLSRFGLPYALIENVVTHESFRNRGFGTFTLKFACDYAFRNGCYKVMLMTGSKSPATLGFYESAGFEQSKAGYQIYNRS